MPRLFVIMPFGIKPIATSAYDFDLVYTAMIRPAALQSGWDVVRIDEVTRVGSITQQYLREIVSADLVLAEISAPNPNVFYELGVRHAASRGGSILVAREGTEIPFD